MRLLTGLVLLAALSGCALFDDDVAEAVDGPVVFSLPVLDLDGAGPEAPQRHLAVRTEASYPCLLPLAVDVDVVGSHLVLVVEGIAEVSGCATAVGPASFSVPLALTDGTYTFTIAHLDRIDHYRIDLVGGAVTVRAIDATVSRYEEPGG